MTRVHDRNRLLFEPLRAAMRAGSEDQLEQALASTYHPQARIRLGYPFGDIAGSEALWTRVFAPLLWSIPDLERRDFIVIAGPRWGQGESSDWVGLGGNMVGTLIAPWLGIPATGKPVFLRYHEYYRIEEGTVTEMEGVWDIPQLMLQAGAWPMAPQLGVEWMCPGPAHGRGVITAPFDARKAEESVRLVWNMLHDLQRGTAHSPGYGLDAYWHPDALWYGPTGIGTARGHDGIRDVVLKSFRRGLSDNVRHLDEGVFFGDHDLVGFTGWPSGTATHSGDGFLGLAPTGRRFGRRSLDFWRVENGLIRENWVMVDMLDLYRQLGVDVFARMRAFTGQEEAL